MDCGELRTACPVIEGADPDRPETGHLTGLGTPFCADPFSGLSVAEHVPPWIGSQRFKTARKPTAVRYRGRPLRGARQCTDVAPPQSQ